ARPTGLIRQLSLFCCTSLQYLALTALVAFVYDNINMMFRAAEQILGRKDAQENGTCATAIPLYNAAHEDMKTLEFLSSFDSARPLELNDITLSSDKRNQYRNILKYTILLILLKQSDGRFDRFREHIERMAPLAEDDIPLHKTEIYPMPYMNIDESSTAGNADVVEAIFKAAGLDIESEEFQDIIRILWGDQLSVARLRSVSAARVGHDSPANALLNIVYGPGLFHFQLAICGAILETHWGDPHSYTKNPSSLCHNNIRLDRKPIVLSSLPPYHTSRDLIFVSLYARVFHCLELVTGKSLNEYVEDVTLEQLLEDVSQLVDRYANTATVSNLREARKDELSEHTNSKENDTQVPSETPDPPPLSSGDMLHENGILFLRDALLFRAFNDAIKAGASGRIVLILKLLALAYRGAGRSKYAHETLHLIHNLTTVWPESIRRIIIQNWLVNPTGRPNSWIPVDLLQEHMNFWIKVIYKAHGSNATTEWLETIAPCIEYLRKLTTQINQELGSRQGSKHASPDLWRDITELMKSFHEHSVYQVEQGRTIDGEKAEVTNILAAGVEMLQKPLDEYNEAFKTLQARRRREPLVRQHSGDVSESVGHLPSYQPATSTSMEPSSENQSRNASQIEQPEEDPDIVWDDTYPMEEEVARDDEILPRETEEDFDLYAD
ncbi:hypothetical protein K474DRAFT_1595949, partial [Panus rudis PR-1116 ss-1]